VRQGLFCYTLRLLYFKYLLTEICNESVVESDHNPRKIRV